MGDSQASEKNTMDSEHHPLESKWVLWAHLPHDTDWSVGSYKQIYEFSTVEEVLSIYANLPPKLVVNCMLFLMRSGITPTWEDPKNRKGGCFSYKLNNKNVPDCWRKISYSTCGETLSVNQSLQKTINGITISPKKNFCILKVWTSTCNYQDASLIKADSGITSHGCLFKKHAPEY
jgi:translation initiation factor 4E